jgi:exodeoxyribonuclease-3
MKIVSWNVAGLRAMLKKPDLYSLIEQFTNDNNKDNDYKEGLIICLQETKCEEQQLPKEFLDFVKPRLPYSYFNASQGITQRKGLSGTSILSSIAPVSCIACPPEFDVEGRIIVLEFERFILINLYVPNSQAFGTKRSMYRMAWDDQLRKYCSKLQEDYGKPLIICGDMNVARTANDIVGPKQKYNKVAGFLQMEIDGIEKHLIELDMIDVFRNKNPDLRASTYWSNFLKQPRSPENGWRIDYFLMSSKLFGQYSNVEISILKDCGGSDHCPLILNI